MKIIAACKYLLSILVSISFTCVSQENFTPANYVQNNILQVPYLPTDYFPEVLKLALDKTVDTHGPYHMYEQAWLGPKERMRQFLIAGRYIRVLWSTTSNKREQQLKAVKFSLVKKLNEYRFLVIHKNEQDKFDAVQSIEDLRQFTAVSGSHWQDTIIFRRNQLPVVTSIDTGDLVKMFKLRRADYFARGAYEVWNELKQPDFAPFQLEQKLLIRYNADYHFFVNHNDTTLAERLLAGLKAAEADGSFDELFFSVPAFKQGWNAVNHSNRLLLELE